MTAKDRKVRNCENGNRKAKGKAKKVNEKVKS